MQAIKASLSILLKETMSVSQMLERENELKSRLLSALSMISGLQLLEPENMNRLGYLSFFMTGLHQNLVVKLLNARFGIQTRGGCSCAGTLGHILLGIDFETSRRITEQIDQGDLSCKPGWVRISLHPTLSDAEVDFISDAIRQVLQHHAEWSRDYRFNHKTGDFDRVNREEERMDLREVF